ncbi:molecular chaperone TorD family protein [Meiothermus sp.]|uniref:TorD/DmsD family molecular chaperone n=1 Tax=Meiothermus sp. TaxID=1955249 RepID=UPI00307DC35F
MQLLGWVTAAAFAPPKAALEHDLVSGTLQAALAEMAKAHDLPIPDLPQMPLSELQAVYTSLFVSNPAGLPCPPYVGMALDERLFGEGFDRLLELYREVGLETSPDWRDLPDHLAAVGEAIALLDTKPAQARTLALDYLYPWLKRYTPILREADSTSFYSAIALFLSQALEVVQSETTAPQLS